MSKLLNIISNNISTININFNNNLIISLFSINNKYHHINSCKQINNHSKIIFNKVMYRTNNKEENILINKFLKLQDNQPESKLRLIF